MTPSGEHPGLASLRRAVLLLLLLGVLALLGMSYLFLQALAGGMARHTEVVSALLQLEAEDGRLHQEVLACRTRASPDCSAVSALSARRVAAAGHLRALLPASSSAAALGQLSGVLEESDAELAVFIERNQRLHEALLALPLAADALHRADGEQPVSLGRSVDSLLSAALQFELRSNQSRAVWSAAEAASALQSTLPEVDAALHPDIKHYLSLTEVIVTEHQAIEHLLATILSPEVAEVVAVLQLDYAGVVAQREREAEIGTVLLYLCALLLFAALVWVTWRLLLMKDRLEVRVEERTEELRHARDAAMASADAKAAFLATMSHELRTPMNGVLGMAQLLRATPLSPVQVECVDTIDISGSALLRLIDNILDFSMLGDGTLELERVGLSIAAVVEACERSAAPAAAEHLLELTAALGPEVHDDFIGDPARLQQVLLSLLSNAIKFTARGSVHLQVSQSDDQLCFAVTDTGIGIPESQLEQLFSLFSQVDSSTTRRYDGAGLGLAVSRKLVCQMGGEIGVRSVEGEGSTFWFVLPCTAQPAGEAPLERAGF